MMEDTPESDPGAPLVTQPDIASMVGRHATVIGKMLVALAVVAKDKNISLDTQRKAEELLQTLLDGSRLVCEALIPEIMADTPDIEDQKRIANLLLFAIGSDEEFPLEKKSKRKKVNPEQASLDSAAL